MASATTTTTAARAHVEEIRRTKFSIGGEPNLLTEELHRAVKNLSSKLYAKDVHFLVELIQNAEDNEYPEGVDPLKDITNTGAPATLLVFNNEKGFLPNHFESICSVGRSTKKVFRKRGYIGEKGIGFKSVFLVMTQPHIFSNGYQIRFNEKPCQQCKVGYIVPEWVDEKDPMLSAIKSIYGSATALPTTTLVLPIKPEKVKPVKDQLLSLHPEVLLLLSKIRRLSVREDDSKLNNIMNGMQNASAALILYLLDFDEEAVEFLMKTKNLQIFVEDHDYLSSAFSSSKANLQEIPCAGPIPGQQPTPRPKKRRGHDYVACELRSTKHRRQRDTVSLTPDPCKSGKNIRN